jgi:hypothetical protein
LGETGLKKKLAYSYPVERKPLDSMSKERLAKIAIIVAGGIVAEERLCGDTGIPKHLAVMDDVRQLNGIQEIAGFSDEEMNAFMQEASELVDAYEPVI